MLIPTILQPCKATPPLREDASYKLHVAGTAPFQAFRLDGCWKQAPSERVCDFGVLTNTHAILVEVKCGEAGTKQVRKARAQFEDAQKRLAQGGISNRTWERVIYCEKLSTVVALNRRQLKKDGISFLQRRESGLNVAAGKVLLTPA